jgi:SAM-dependent methyltransferase
MTDANPYIGAYPWLDERRGVWREIARFVARDAPNASTVLELGAGYCDFINQFTATTKIAFDLNPDNRKYAAKDVDLRIEDATLLRGVGDASIDLVFASNFLEHLDEAELATLLPNVHRVLRPRGRLILIQPNYLRCPEHYFDDPTHKTIFDHVNIARHLEPQGFRVLKVVPGQLPFSMKSRLPKWPILTRLYLNSPVRPLGAQMYVVAERRA